MTDLKKIGPTPGVLHDIANELFYPEWKFCKTRYGDDHNISIGFGNLLDFMLHGYEKQLVTGELWRASDTPKAVLNRFLKEQSAEFLSYAIGRPSEHIKNLLDSTLKLRQEELERYKHIESDVRKETEQNPDDPHIWNKFRLLLWILGKYSESSKAFQKAKRLGWTVSDSKLVSL